MNEGGAAVPFVRTSLGATQASTLGADATSQDRVVEFLRGRRDNEGRRRRPVPRAPEPPRRHRQLAAGAGRAARLGVRRCHRPGLLGVQARQGGQAHAPLRRRERRHAARLRRRHRQRGLGVRAAGPLPQGAARGQRQERPARPHLPAGRSAAVLAPLLRRCDAPRVVDVDFGSSDWRTLLVTGLGKGGNSYYALDVTDPASITDEASAASKVLWRFTDPDMGYTFGRPTIAKTRAHGWVVVVSAGYNNASGEGQAVRPARKRRRPAEDDVDRGRLAGEPERARALLGLHAGLPQPGAGADLRRRPVRQRVALRPVRRQRRQLGGREVRGADRLRRHTAADHHTASRRRRRRERHRPLGVRRHGPPAARGRPLRHADAAHVRDARRHVQDAVGDRRAAHVERPRCGLGRRRPRRRRRSPPRAGTTTCRSGSASSRHRWRRSG